MAPQLLLVPLYQGQHGFISRYMDCDPIDSLRRRLFCL